VTETEVHVEHEHAESESIAEEVAEEVREVLEEVHEDEEQRESIQAVEEHVQEIASEASNHSHAEYSPVGHSHSEYASHEFVDQLNQRISTIEAGLAEEVEEPVVEEIEPTEEHHEPPAPKRRHKFGRR
jgi:hypothetical protein